MTDSLSQRFIQALEPQRDPLYALALTLAPSPAAAEGLLQKTLRTAFHAYAQQPPADFSTWILQQLRAAANASATAAPALPTAPDPPPPMPADTWARLTAGIQIEAAKSGHSKALNPESVLLSPDPLLAPKKRFPHDDPVDGLNLSPTSRFVLAVAIALVVGISLSLYYCTRTIPAPTPKPPTTSTTK